MNVRRVIPVVVALGFCIGAAQAQSTLGEAMDKGFKKVEKAEFNSLFIGAKIAGPNQNNAEMLGEYRADGTLTGTWRHPTSMQQGVYSGTWKLEDNGRICAVITSGGAPTSTCFFFFRSGTQYYLSPSDTDRAAKILPRTVTR